VVVQWSAHPIR